MYLYSTSTEEMQQNMNVAKEVLLIGLEKEGLLTKTAKEVGENYALVLHKKGWLGSLWSRLFSGEKKEELRVSFVKLVE